MNFLKKHIIVILGLLFLASCNFWQSNIKEINSLQQASQDINDADPKTTLVIFDIDRTLLVPVDKILRIRWNPEVFNQSDVQFAQKLLSEYQNKLKIKSNYSPNYETKSLSTIMEKEIYKPIEPITVDFIKKLQLQGFKVIALTSIQTGKFGIIKDMSEWRYKTLKRYGIDFSHNFVFTKIVFDKLKPTFDSYPVFYKGLLLTGKFNPKGNVLKTFFNSINWKPEKIFFFDDTKKHLISVCDEMNKYEIETQGYWYKATFNSNPKLTLNRDIIKFQYEQLEKNRIYYTDIEAKAKLYLNKTANNTKQLSI